MLNMLRCFCVARDRRYSVAVRGGLWFAGGLVCCFASGGQTLAAGPGINPKQLRCEYLVNPLGIDEAQPRLTWGVESRQRGQRQTAYQILVASDEARLQKDRGDLWDSGKVESGETVGIVYAGKGSGLAAAVFLEGQGLGQGRASRPLERAGTVDDGSAQARRLAGAVHQLPRHHAGAPICGPVVPAAGPPVSQGVCRRQAVRRATVYATALGIYELHLNGQRVGDASSRPAGRITTSAPITGPTT